MILDGFNSADDVFDSFTASESEREDANIIFAHYRYEDYTGYAFVLFEKHDQLYEVHGSHCSCHGLEGQWTPEETDRRSIEYRMNNGQLGSADYYGNSFVEELRESLDEALGKPFMFH